MITEDYSQVIVPKTKKNTINLKKMLKLEYGFLMLKKETILEAHTFWIKSKSREY